MRTLVMDSLSPRWLRLSLKPMCNIRGLRLTELSPGGNTPRRLLHAYTRDRAFRQWANSSKLTSRVRQLLASDQIELSQNHHNCVMTKNPGYSSATLWHQDIRYWAIRSAATG